MNERLDRLEKDILGQLNANYRRLKSEMDHVLKDLDYRKQGVKTLQNALAKAKNIETEVELLMNTVHQVLFVYGPCKVNPAWGFSYTNVSERFDIDDK
jgi:hypothetical protein